jgi:hypothetical protein
MRFVELTQTKINSIIRAMNDGANRCSHFLTDDGQDPGWWDHGIFLHGSRVSPRGLGFTEAKDQTQLKIYQEHEYPQQLVGSTRCLYTTMPKFQSPQQ